MKNVAEGFEQCSDTEFHRFLDIAKGACGEVRSMYYTPQDLNHATAGFAAVRRDAAKHISAGIAPLMSHLKP